jgi:hypothetical protein
MEMRRVRYRSVRDEGVAAGLAKIQGPSASRALRPLAIRDTVDNAYLVSPALVYIR